MQSHLLYYTDLHVSDASLGTCNSIYEQLVQTYKRSRLPLKLVFGGDLFHSRRVQSHATLSFVQRWLRKLDDCFGKGNVFFLAGNHDKVDTSSDDSWLDLYVNRSYGVQRFDKSSNLQFAFLDFFDREVYKEKLKVLSEQLGSAIKDTVLFTHIGIDGIVSHHSSEATTDMFKGFHKVISGHYHNRSEHGNVHYAGSTHQANFGDDDDKGFLSIQVRKNAIEARRIKTKYKKYITYKCRTFDISEFIEGVGGLVDAHYRVVCEGEELSEEAVHFLREQGIILQYKSEADISANIEEGTEKGEERNYVSLLEGYLKADDQSDDKKSFNKKLVDDFERKVSVCLG